MGGSCELADTNWKSIIGFIKRIFSLDFDKPRETIIDGVTFLQ